MDPNAVAALFGLFWMVLCGLPIVLMAVSTALVPAIARESNWNSTQESRFTATMLLLFAVIAHVSVPGVFDGLLLMQFGLKGVF